MESTTSLKKTLRHRGKELKLGPHPCCARCPETDPRALQRTELILCAGCRLALSGKPTTERHHPAGRHNDAFTAPLPANGHAALSDAQHDWPEETLRNPNDDFLRALAGWLRCFADMFRFVGEQAEAWAKKLERYSTVAAAKMGAGWWHEAEAEAAG